MDGLDDKAVAALLRRTRRVVVVGASANPARASYGVMRFLMTHGYDVTPVNPGLTGQYLLGCKVVDSLAHAGLLDMVDVFRNSAQAGEVVDEAIRLGAKCVWLQLGVIDAAALERARQAGLTGVMDRCPAVEWSRLGLGQSQMQLQQPYGTGSA